MNDTNRKLWLNAQEALHKLERGLTEELHSKEPGQGKKTRERLAVEYGGVAAAKAALDTVG